jgi:hypothetical protein
MPRFSSISLRALQQTRKKTKFISTLKSIVVSYFLTRVLEKIGVFLYCFCPFATHFFLYEKRIKEKATQPFVAKFSMNDFMRSGGECMNGDRVAFFEPKADRRL